MNRLLKANIAMAFSDPAGANACLAVAKMKELKGIQKPLIFTNRQPQVALEYNLPITISSEIPNLNEFEIEYLFTGTSHPQSSDNFENKCIANALKNKIYSISFIDHWTNFKLRFSGLQDNTYPDEIWVVDEPAKLLAIDEGLPAEKIKVHENPYHYYLKNYWQSSFKGKEYLLNLGLKVHSSVILYAPDPVSLRPGVDEIGFSEIEVLQDLIRIIKEIKTKPLLLVKLHPLQPKEEIKKLIEAEGFENCIILNEVNIPELLNAVDFVIGFYSNILLEAVALNKKVIRYFPGIKEKDLLRHTKKGILITEKAGLSLIIKKLTEPVC